MPHNLCAIKKILFHQPIYYYRFLFLLISKYFNNYYVFSYINIFMYIYVSLLLYFSTSVLLSSFAIINISVHTFGIRSNKLLFPLNSDNNSSSNNNRKIGKSIIRSITEANFVAYWLPASMIWIFGSTKICVKIKQIYIVLTCVFDPG